MDEIYFLTVAAENRQMGEGAHIYTFAFPDCKHNRFQKKLMMHNTNV